MKFSTNEDIEAPIDAVFELFSDFDSFERSALRRGGDVRRTDRLGRKGVGMTWAASFKLRGKDRAATAEMVEFSAPDTYCIEANSVNVTGFFTLELVPMSKNRTRAAMSVELKPNSLSGRLMVQSLKLGKTRLNRRFKIKAADFAKGLEDQYKSAQRG